MPKRITQEDFIENATKVHSNKYDYSESIYINSYTKIEINCLRHGIFYQTYSTHVTRGCGCRKCFDEKHSKESLHTKEYILIQFDIKHKKRFTYPYFKYTGLHQKIKIICPIHGIFTQSIQSHIAGSSCPECSNVKPHTIDTFIRKVSDIHNFKYDYSLAKYVNNNTYIDIICPEHGIFSQKPRGHLKYGCPECHVRGYTKSNWIKITTKNNKSTLYVIKCFNKEESFIKIGITSHNLNSRFKSKELPYSYEIISLENESPEFIWNKEKELHKKYRIFSYKPNISFAGETECFTLDILELL